MTEAPTYKKPPLIPVAPIKFNIRLLSTAHKIRLVFLLTVALISGLLGLIPPFNWVWYISLGAFIIGAIDFYSTYFINRKIEVRKSKEVSKLCSMLNSLT